MILSGTLAHFTAEFDRFPTSWDDLSSSSGSRIAALEGTFAINFAAFDQALVSYLRSQASLPPRDRFQGDIPIVVRESAHSSFWYSHDSGSSDRYWNATWMGSYLSMAGSPSMILNRAPGEERLPEAEPPRRLLGLGNLRLLASTERPADPFLQLQLGVPDDPYRAEQGVGLRVGGAELWLDRPDLTTLRVIDVPSIAEGWPADTTIYQFHMFRIYASSKSIVGVAATFRDGDQASIFTPAAGEWLECPLSATAAFRLFPEPPGALDH